MNPPSPLHAPRDLELDEAVALLAARGDNVAVVRIVEQWAAQSTPTLRARNLQAAAFFHLRLMDRALHRTREVLEAEPENGEALLLQARVYLERGWPAKARRPLQQLQDAGHAGLDALWTRAHAEPVRPEANARDIEREGNPARLLALAESFMATGSFLRATGILERLRRSTPNDPRIRELLWALAGDFTGGGQGLDALLAALAPVLLPRENTVEEPENTESLLLQGSEPDLRGSFPALFKWAPGTPPSDRAGADVLETTQSSGLATRAQLAELPPGADIDGPDQRRVDLGGGGPNDTQIMLVLRPGEDRGGPVHRRREDASPDLKSTLNLRAWQASMGVAPGSDLGDAANDDLLEEEDENVVVMTRGETAPAAPGPAETFSTPIEVIEKHAVPLVPAPYASAVHSGGPDDPDPTVEVPLLGPPPSRPVEAAPPEAPAAEVAPSDAPPPEAPEAPAAGRRVALPLVAVAAVLVLVAGVFALRGALSAGAGPGVRPWLVEALAGEDYNALLLTESQLERTLESTPEDDAERAVVRAALAETRLVLWSDYNGDPTRLAAARADIEAGGETDLHRLAMLRAAEALARQDVAGATAALGREKPLDDEERLLFARIAAEGGDTARALDHLGGIEQPQLPRYRLVRAQVLARAGRTEEALAAVDSVLAAQKGHAAAEALRIELSAGDPDATLAAIQAFLDGGTALPPRIEGRLALLQTRIFLAQGKPDEARQAVERGLARDGTNPDLLFLRAAELAGAQKLTDALHELAAVVEARPGDEDAQVANVLLLLDLDRVEEARAAVAALEAGATLPELTPVLSTLVSVWGLQERPATTLLPTHLASPLGTVTAALNAIQERSADAAIALQTAVDAARGSADPFVQRLAPRLAAMRASVAGAADGDALARAALDMAPDDPAVHVYIARYYEGTERRALAAQHFDRAAQLGPELGFALYERGRFYLDARDGQARSDAAWRDYLALAPSGPRATRAKDTLDRR